MRYRLRTLLIVLALGPPVLAGAWIARDWIPADIEAAVGMLSALGIYLGIVTLAVVLHLRSSSHRT